MEDRPSKDDALQDVLLSYAEVIAALSSYAVQTSLVMGALAVEDPKGARAQIKILADKAQELSAETNKMLASLKGFVKADRESSP